VNGYFRDYVLDGEWHSLLPRYFLLSSIVGEKKILDISCGSGIGSALLLELGAASVNAIDHRPGVISIAKMKHQGENLTFQEMFLEDLEFPDSTFDIVLCLDTHSPVSDPNFIDEIKRVLKKEGQYVCAIQKSTDQGLESILPQYGYINSGEYRNAFEMKNIPQIGNLSDRFACCHQTVQRPVLSYHFESSIDEPDIVHDLQVEKTDSVEIWFCGEKCDAPKNVEVRLPYFALMGKIRSILANANQSPGLHNSGLASQSKRERESTSEFKVVSLDDRDTAPLDDLGLEEDTNIVHRDSFDISKLYSQMKDDFQNVVSQAQSALAERDTYISHLVDTVHSWEQRFKDVVPQSGNVDNTETTERSALKKSDIEKAKSQTKKTVADSAKKKPSKTKAKSTKTKASQTKAKSKDSTAKKSKATPAKKAKTKKTAKKDSE